MFERESELGDAFQKQSTIPALLQSNLVENIFYITQSKARSVETTSFSTNNTRSCLMNLLPQVIL